jgi:hypothetical protein
MSSDAGTFPLPDPALGPGESLRAARERLRSGERAGAGASLWPGRLALMTIPLCSALIVLMAANRPSLLVATSHANFFPRWMAGPLGGLLPGLTHDSTKLKDIFTGAMVLSYLAYMLVLVHAPRLRARWVLGAIAAVHVIFLISPPLALTDIFNYLNYGRMEVLHHLNPYTTIPISEPHTDPSYALSNWHQLLSPYGPLFTLLTFVFVPLGVAASFWSLKVLLTAASLGMLYLIWKCARLLGRDPLLAVAFVGLNPIVLVWGLGSDHNDFLMMFLIVLALYLLLAARARAQEHPNGAVGGRIRRLLLPLEAMEVGAGVALVGAASIKASGAVVIPVVLAGLLRTPRRLVQVALGMALGVLVIGAASLQAFGLHVPDLSTQSRLVTNFSIPNLTGLAVGAGGETTTLHTVFSALLLGTVAVCCLQAWRRRSWITASGWATAALLITLGWSLPWYVLWVLPLAALGTSRRLRGVALVLGAYLIVAWAPASGLLWKAIGFHPDRTSLGRLHQRYVKELLN